MQHTDLALEAHQQVKQEAAHLNGVTVQEQMQEQIRVTRVQITEPEAARKLDKPLGTYITLELEQLLRQGENIPEQAGQVLAEQLGKLLPAGPVLVTGLGNAAVTPDAVGPRSLEHLLVTRHLQRYLPEVFGSLRSCSAFAPGVLGSTGIESAQMVRGIVELSGAAALIVVDALAACEEKRLCTTVQLADTGIVPGSGIGNHRAAFDETTMGIPVIAVGVPTVIRAEVLCGKSSDLIVTPSDIDRRVAQMARIIGAGINRALFPELDAAEIERLTATG